MTFYSRIDEYKRMIEEFRESGSAETLANILESLPDVINEIIDNKISELKEKINNINEINITNKKILGIIKDLESRYNDLADSIDSISKLLSELNKRVSNIEMIVGGLTEATISKLYVEELINNGYIIRQKIRNYELEGEDIDLLVIASKEGVEEHHLVEVKVKPRHSDIGALLAKADLYEVRFGVKPKPVLAGVMIGGEVEAYARSRGVLVFKV